MPAPLSDLTELHQAEQLDALLAESSSHPVLIYKHSSTCGISAQAYDELLAHLDAPVDGVRYAMVTVQTDRDISNAIATRLAIRHETPQALLVRDGRVVWSVSHYRVNAAALAAALQAHATTQPTTSS